MDSKNPISKHCYVGSVSHESSFANLLHKESRADRAQSTVEYALITAGLIIVIIGLGAMARVWNSGEVVSHALASASHSINGMLGCIADVFCY